MHENNTQKDSGSSMTVVAVALLFGVGILLLETLFWAGISVLDAITDLFK
jgi:hypothetical protein